MTDRIRKRRRHSPRVEGFGCCCQEPNASVARIARQHDLNANLIQTWIRKARQPPPAMHALAFVPLELPAHASLQDVAPLPVKDAVISINIPSAHGTLTVHWLLSAADQCATWLKRILS